MEIMEPGGDPFEKSIIQPSMEKFVEETKQNHEKEEIVSSTTLVGNGCVDIRGKVADKQTTGGWKAAPFIIVNEVAERLAFFAIAVNMVAYLVFEYHQSLPSAATHVTDWIGAAYVLTLLGAFLADAYLGRFLTIIIFSCIYAVITQSEVLHIGLDGLKPIVERPKIIGLKPKLAAGIFVFLSSIPFLFQSYFYQPNTVISHNSNSCSIPFTIPNKIITILFYSHFILFPQNSNFILFLPIPRTKRAVCPFFSQGMVLLTLSASIDSLRPPPCTARPCTKAADNQSAFLFVALALIALGTGGIKPCVSSFGADQFDEADEKEVQKKYSFFNWFFFAINIGALLGITLLVYMQDKKGWGWGFGVPTMAMVCSTVILGAGIPYYRYQKPMGSPFTRFLQVIVASVRNHFKGVRLGREAVLYEVNTLESDIFGARKLAQTKQYRFLDMAAVVTDPEGNIKNRWRLCTVTQVEEFKSFVRILPVWASTIALSISFAQLSTFFISQATIMDRKLGPNFTIPAGSVPVFSAINALLLVPIYEKWMVPILRKRTGHHRGITSLQRMGVGLFISIFALASAALVEKKRRDHPKPSSMSVFWLLPQFFLIGSAEVFTYVGQLEFFYDEATDGTRSISSAMFLSEIGIGSWLSTAFVKIIERATGGDQKGWLRNDLNKSRLDYFYWILTAINAVNFLDYLWVAWRYKGKNGLEGSARVKAMAEPAGYDKGEFQSVVL
ncbi:Peptide transporter 5 [Theobroma cacao]|uniref:Peptide transporter 5 n=1 Tax=Theobroma cacao TaxID=3641 RepID=A0A061FCV7_THECC|nr:Peptide transporter 5 [Theobroma cacao]